MSQCVDLNARFGTFVGELVPRSNVERYNEHRHYQQQWDVIGFFNDHQSVTNRRARIDQFGEKLAAWRAVRQSAAQGTQSYDKASLTRALIPARSSKSSHIPFQSSLVDLDERFRLPNQHGVPLHHQAPP